MGQSCSCLEQGQSTGRRRSSSSSPQERPRTVERSQVKTMPNDARNVVKRCSKTIDHESAYTAFVYQGMDPPPKKKESCDSSEPRSSTDTTLVELECVMCLDNFSDDNPKIRTLCNCGVNRTNFHLSCLYEWVERDRNCPVCRAVLYFEEN
ncbi:hypothetical protein THRCLA_05921 [Thraustotheca clavata]|uniref:RING-type E3 ubiquitin transferase n=1 Tax=Thraustotheca clavata TaxID=74557 RepID=A0A1V9ZRF8_9STRA|nr:hypothetical protein THRCLA_05921 [Thraustotheca clavata]